MPEQYQTRVNAQTRLLILCAVALLSFVVAIVSGWMRKDTGILRDYAADVSRHLAAQETKARAWCEREKPYLQQAMRGAADSGRLPEGLEELAAEDFTILLHFGDSVVFWSNNKAIATPPLSPDYQPLRLPLGFYVAKTSAFESGQLTFLLPVRYTIRAEEGAAVVFPADARIPETARIADAPTPYVIEMGGINQFWLEAAGDLQPAWLKWVSLMAYIVFGVALLGLLNALGDWLSARSRAWAERPLVQRGLASLPAGLLFAAGIYACAYAAHVASVSPMVELDYENILYNSAYGVPALLGVAALSVALFFLGYRLMWIVRQLGLPITWRAGIILFSAFAVYFAGILSGIGDPLLMAAAALLFGLLLDYLSGETQSDITWIILWLLLSSAYLAGLFYRQKDVQETAQRRAYAQALAVQRDSAYAEPLLKRVAEKIMSDEQLPVLLKPWPFKPEAQAVRNHLNALAYRENYLFQHYRLRVFALEGELAEPLLLDQTQGFDEIVTRNWEQGKPLPGAEHIRYLSDAEGVFRYMIHARPLRMKDPGHPVDLYCFFDHVYPIQSKVYARIFYGEPYKKLDHLFRYDYAVMAKDRLAVQQGQPNPAAFSQQLPAGATRVLRDQKGRRYDAVSRSADGTALAVAGRAGGGWSKPLYLFAILFTLSSVWLFLLALINAGLGLLPHEHALALSAKGSLAKRIHYANLLLLALGFVLIGLMTYNHFTYSARERERADLNYRAEAMLTHLRNRFGGLSPHSDSLRRALAPALADMAASLSMDANLYSPDNGALLFTTRDDLRSLGVLPGKMDMASLYALQKGNVRDRTTPEQLSGNSFWVKYLALYNQRNQLMGFLGVPYQSDERAISASVSDFLGMLAGLYVFLLLMAVGATYFVARSITKPINLIADKIKDLQFQDKNQPLDYQGDQQDELGSLIAEYNRMVDKLEDSKAKLIRLEREGAWREMARQIAHDIKNPLTTMKLSMQQLERVANNPEQAAAYLKKATGRLIEQIDSLAQTASEFSMFANLDIKHKGDVTINDVVESVYDLFTEQKDADLSLNMPVERLNIKGDKNHLLRVFNNLVINAIQAIPSDRRGNVNVSLYREEDKAIVKISDNGGGIPPEIRTRVFEPNFTTKTSGSGLGLAICKKIIEAHDGDIRFETRDNEGTDFYVEMPVVSIGHIGLRVEDN